MYKPKGAGLVLSLEQSVSKNTRSIFRKVFMFALFLVTLLYIVFGIMGYLSFGPETQEIITLNLPAGPFPFIVKTCLCFSLFFTYPIMMFPVSEILEKRLSCTDATNNNYTNYMMGTILRTLLVIITGVIVLAIPTFSTLMALVGSTCCTLLGFILPALFHLKLFKRDLSRWQFAFDVFLIVLGLVGAMLGTHDALVRLFTDKTTSLVSTLPNVTTSG